MNVNQTMHQANLSKWTALFHEQRQSGLTIKDWCSQNNENKIDNAEVIDD